MESIRISTDGRSPQSCECFLAARSNIRRYPVRTLGSGEPIC